MYIVKSPLKCNGEVYKKGDKFNQEPSEQLLASGALEKEEDITARERKSLKEERAELDRREESLKEREANLPDDKLDEEEAPEGIEGMTVKELKAEAEKLEIDPGEVKAAKNKAGLLELVLNAQKTNDDKPDEEEAPEGKPDEEEK